MWGGGDAERDARVGGEDSARRAEPGGASERSEENFREVQEV